MSDDKVMGTLSCPTRPAVTFDTCSSCAIPDESLKATAKSAATSSSVTLRPQEQRIISQGSWHVHKWQWGRVMAHVVTRIVIAVPVSVTSPAETPTSGTSGYPCVPPTNCGVDTRLGHENANPGAGALPARKDPS